MRGDNLGFLHETEPLRDVCYPYAVYESTTSPRQPARNATTRNWAAIEYPHMRGRLFIGDGEKVTHHQLDHTGPSVRIVRLLLGRLHSHVSPSE